MTNEKESANLESAHFCLGILGEHMAAAVVDLGPPPIYIAQIFLFVF